MAEQVEFPAWVVPGARVAVVRAVMGKTVAVSLTAVEKVTKTQVALTNAKDSSDRWRGNHFYSDRGMRSSGGTWSNSYDYLYPLDDPRVAEARREVRIAVAKNEIDTAYEAFRSAPSAETAKALAKAANVYTALTSATPENFETVYQSFKDA